MSESMSTPLPLHGVPHGRHLRVVRPTPPAPRPAPAWASRLSAREVEVLNCIAAGLSTNEIARTLFISIPTVKSHVARLIQKVGVRDRVQLVVVAFRSGFISVD